MTTNKRTNNADILVNLIEKFISDQQKIIIRQEGYPMPVTAYKQLEDDVHEAVESATHEALMKIKVYEPCI